jgi:hypothetical protein
MVGMDTGPETGFNKIENSPTSLLDQDRWLCYFY